MTGFLRDWTLLPENAPPGSRHAHAMAAIE